MPGIEVDDDDKPPTVYSWVAALQLRSPGWVDLPKQPGAAGADGILQALAQIAPDDNALVQLLLTPTWMTTDNGKQPAFWFSGRVASSSRIDTQAQANVALISSTFGQFTEFNGIKVGLARRARDDDNAAVSRRQWTRRILPEGAPATPAQIAHLYHPPTEPVNHPTLRCSLYTKTPASQSEGVLLGTGRDNRGLRANVSLPPADLARHGLVVGPSGTGKSTFLAHLARELAAAGHGVTVIDPHGSLVRDIARTLPARRVSAAALLRLADHAYPIGINPLRARAGHEFLAADEFVEVLQRVYGGAYWGPLIDLTLRHASMAAIELGGSVVESARLLDDPWYRERALEQIGNQESIRILGQLGDGLDRRLLPAINRLQRLLATPWLRNIVAQADSPLDFSDLFEHRRITLIDLSDVGTTNARLLGSLLLLLIRQATLGRNTGAAAPPKHFVIIDEASWFVSRTVVELFDQARKFGVGVVLAVQRLGQLAPEEVRDGIMTNAGTVLSFRIHDRDEATTIARHFSASAPTADDLQHLARFEAYLQITRDGERLSPAWLRTSDPSTQHPNPEFERHLLAEGRRLYARPREIVEADLSARARLTASNDEPEIAAFAPAANAFLAHAA